MKLITEQWLNNAKEDLSVIEEIIHIRQLFSCLLSASLKAMGKLFRTHS
jgi:hypothetical protein